MLVHSENLYAVDQIRRLEEYVIDGQLLTAAELMERAAASALEVLTSQWVDAQSLAIFCGKGNNGGDGLTLARLAFQQGYKVKIYSLYQADELHDLPAQQAKAALELGIEWIDLASVEAEEMAADVIVDALLGIGLTGPVADNYRAAIDLINQSSLPVLALDLPSGLDANSGRVYGVAVHADITVTFIGYKQGMFTHKALNDCGKVVLSNLNLPDDAFAQIAPTARLLTWKQIRQLLPRRERDCHKGECGHVLVVGGDYGMGGAVRMAAEAAYRVGAGLVSVATRPEHAAVVSTGRPEIMSHQVNGAEDLLPLLEKCSVVVIGPGLGQSEWAVALFEAALQASKPMVVDADALNLLAAKHRRHDNWIITPHPGEAARLLNAVTEEIQDDRFSAVTELQQCYGGVVVLKGAGSIIKSADPIPRVCRAGNPGMATGGMGDILSGVLGGLLAQGLDIFAAAEVGVFVHAVAADRAAEELGERGLLASDLFPHLHRLVNVD